MRRGCNVRKLSSFQDYGAAFRRPGRWPAGGGQTGTPEGSQTSRCTPQAGTPASQGNATGAGERGLSPFGNRPGLVEVTGATRRAGIERTPLCGDTLDSGRHTGWLPAQCRGGAASSKNRRKLSISAGE